jgi:hypothetical protein
MERMSYRSTSLAHLLADIRQRELLAEAERRRGPYRSGRRRTFLGLPLPGFRQRA